MKAHYRANGPDTGRNSGKRPIKKRSGNDGEREWEKGKVRQILREREQKNKRERERERDSERESMRQSR